MKIELTKKERRMLNMYLYSENCILKEKGARFLYGNSSERVVKFLISKIMERDSGYASVRARYGLSIMNKKVVLKNIKKTLSELKGISYSSALYLLKACEGFGKDFEDLIKYAINSNSKNLIHAALSFLIEGKLSDEFIKKNSIHKIISENLKNKNYILGSIIVKVGPQYFKEEIRDILKSNNLDIHKKNEFLLLGDICKLNEAREELINIVKNEKRHLISRVNAALDLSSYFDIDTSDELFSLINKAPERLSLVSHWIDSFENLIANHSGFKKTKEMLNSKDYKIICFGLGICGLFGIKKAEGLIMKFLEDKNPLIRATALKAIGQIKSDKNIEKVKTCLKDKVHYVRKSAVFALGKMNFKDKNKILLKILNDKSAVVKQEALKALSESTDLNMKKQILNMINSNDYLKREAALSYVLKNNLVEARRNIIKYLSNYAYKDYDSERITMISALGKLGKTEDISILKKMLKDNYPKVRVAALMAINEIRIREENNLITLNFKMR